ncbi:TetR/AcrR family transcriptional regulator [Streptomyces sp. 4F14]|uniref:TetR/AcrR family transcriptional regulator n=1 Tax=Streptomyces sp. 4F14 TaxID=3394380 RepID=UPI003A8A8499
MRRHAERIERDRARLVAQAGEFTDLRTWAACTVRPVTGHLDSLGSPSWYARFMTQVTVDPALRTLVSRVLDAESPSLLRLRDELYRLLPELPPEAFAERGAMTRHLITQMCVEREHGLAEGSASHHRSWDEVADGLVDAIVALWRAPVTTDAGGSASGGP